MNRITYIDRNGVVYCRGGASEARKRLSEYESLGLSPSEIATSLREKDEIIRRLNNQIDRQRNELLAVYQRHKGV